MRCPGLQEEGGLADKLNLQQVVAQVPVLNVLKFNSEREVSVGVPGVVVKHYWLH